LDEGGPRVDEGEAVAQARDLEYALHRAGSLDDQQFPFRRARGRVGMKGILLGGLAGSEPT
jgi:hypothetical protein